MTAKRYQIPRGTLDEHIIVLGKTRKGKSSVMRSAFIEPLLDDGHPVCIIDPKGDHWGLKLSKSGQRPGYPVVIFGGDYADVPINEHSGASIAELVATGNRPCIIDLGGWMVGARTRFFNAFAETFFRLNRGQRWLVIDEVHNFAPQGSTMKNPDRAMMVHWANRLASEGLGRGINLIVASQRPQKVHKDLVTSCETLIAMGVNHHLDREQIRLWIEGCGDPAKGKEVLASLARLKKGEAFVWSPEIDFGPKRKQFRLFRTYDSFAPRRASQKKLKGWASVDLEEVKEKLATVVAEAEAKDPVKLRRRIIELERQLQEKDNPVDDPRVPELAAQNDTLRQQLKVAQKTIDDVAALVGVAQVEVSVVHPPVELISKPAAPPPATPISSLAPKTNGLGKGELAILTAIAQHPEGCDREQVSVLTRYKTSSRNTYIQRLASAGLVSIGPPLRATEAGIIELGDDFKPLPTGARLREHWLQNLTGGEREILRVLIESYPVPMRRDEISARTNYKTSSRNTYLQRLRARKLVTATHDGILASDRLF